MTSSAKGTPGETGTQIRQKAGLNREIHSQGWYGIRHKSEYKRAWNNRVFTPAPAQKTSTTCGNCGHSEKANRPSQAGFRHKKCAFEANADVNDAENIQHQSTALAIPANRRTKDDLPHSRTKSRATSKTDTTYHDPRGSPTYEGMLRFSRPSGH